MTTASNVDRERGIQEIGGLLLAHFIYKCHIRTYGKGEIELFIERSVDLVHHIPSTIKNFLTAAFGRFRSTLYGMTAAPSIAAQKARNQEIGVMVNSHKNEYIILAASSSP